MIGSTMIAVGNIILLTNIRWYTCTIATYWWGSNGSSCDVDDAVGGDDMFIVYLCIYILNFRWCCTYGRHNDSYTYIGADNMMYCYIYKSNSHSTTPEHPNSQYTLCNTRHRTKNREDQSQNCIHTINSRSVLKWLAVFKSMLGVGRPQTPFYSVIRWHWFVYVSSLSRVVPALGERVVYLHVKIGDD